MPIGGVLYSLGTQWTFECWDECPKQKHTHVQVQLETIDIFLLACHVCGSVSEKWPCMHGL